MKIIFCFVALMIFVQSNAIKPYFNFNQKALMIPHPDKAEKGGQDAFYASQNLLVVADGVGGWNAQGIDPNFCAVRKRYSQIGAQVYYNEDPQFYNSNPIELIIKAQSKNNYVGSSTMVVLTLDGRLLKSCYIGDSGFVVIRVFNQTPLIIYQFSQQEHSFNFPFQLAQKKYNGDDPKNSICVNLDVQEGDIIVAGSDGLFDNIFVDEILATVEDALNSNESQLFQLPKLFAEKAIQRGQSDVFSSPFAQRANDLGIEFTGGKLDDTTVIVARIQGQQEDEIDIQNQSL